AKDSVASEDRVQSNNSDDELGREWREDGERSNLEIPLPLVLPCPPFSSPVPYGLSINEELRHPQLNKLSAGRILTSSHVSM
ncbi:hypothetical protein, partial [Candidatus Ichthyocystis sparus]|uniref:hypothetical protein n=1 Tax=Candidatus Ichthyocystis sparus TaxID=1561004 RepID=UPI00159EF1A0